MILLLPQTLLTLALAALATAKSTLFVAAPPLLSTLSLEGSKLSVETSTDSCGPTPSWLVISPKTDTLYCLDANPTANGTISSYAISYSDSLSLKYQAESMPGPVSGTLFADGAGLATANYHSQSIQSWQTEGLSEIQIQTFKQAAPGPVVDRQEAPHPHQAILDPTKKFVFIPDLGADLIRVFSFPDGAVPPSGGDGGLRQHSSLQLPPGSGPRHVAFWADEEEEKEEVYLYVLTELTNSILSYKVNYSAPSEALDLSFAPLAPGVSSGGDITPRLGAAASEILLSPDSRFLTVSNRNDSSVEGSDSLVTFALQQGGGLKFVQRAAAGGRGPRHFSFNDKGNKVAVGLQLDGVVAVRERNVKTGLIGAEMARVNLTAVDAGANVNYVGWA